MEAFDDYDDSHRQQQFFLPANGKTFRKAPPNCSLEDYHSFYWHQFHHSMFPFSSDCLMYLLSNQTSDLTLRVGWIRLQYMVRHQNVTNHHILYLCRMACGGMGDRIRAMLNSFYLALATGASFSINVEQPVHWDDFFLPLNADFETSTSKNGFLARHGWQQDYIQHSKEFDLLKKILNDSTVDRSDEAGHWDQYLGDDEKHPRYDYFIQSNLKTRLFDWDDDSAREIVVLSGNTFRTESFKQNRYAKDFWNHYALKDLGRAERSYIFYQLFMARPSLYLETVIAPYLPRLQHTYVIGMQIRLGNTFNLTESGWGEDERHRAGCVICMAIQAKAMCGQQRQCAIWVASDTPSALTEIETFFQNDDTMDVVYSRGPLTHMDRSDFRGKDTLRFNARTFVDWYVMAEYSDAFILSRSGFGEHASWYKLKNHTHFRPAFQFVSDDPNCLFQDFRQIQNRLSWNEY